MSKTDTDREKRLAEALRQNLHRRKAQARGGSNRPESDDNPQSDRDLRRP